MLHPCSAKREALVGGVDDQRVVELAAVLQRCDHFAHAFVDGQGALIDLLHPLAQRHASLVMIEVVFLLRGLALARLAILAGHPGLGLIQIPRLVRTRPKDVRWHIHLLALIGSFVAVCRSRGAMHGAVAKPEDTRAWQCRASCPGCSRRPTACNCPWSSRPLFVPGRRC